SPCAGVIQTARYNPLTFSLASATFAGVSGLTIVSSFASRPLPPVLPAVALPPSPTLAACALCSFCSSLRRSPRRARRLLLRAIILAYVGILATLYLSGSEISYEERHLRFAGVLVFLLFLLAAATRTGMARYAGPIVTGLFGLYGAASYTTAVPHILREHISD